MMQDTTVSTASVIIRADNSESIPRYTLIFAELL